MQELQSDKASLQLLQRGKEGLANIIRSPPHHGLAVAMDSAKSLDLKPFAGLQ